MNPVSVIIVNYNGKKYIDRCLSGLFHQSYKTYSICIVDNGSEDESREYIEKKYPQVRLVCLENNLGFSAANNLAIRSGSGPYIALLNPDAVPGPNWMGKLVEALDSNPKAGFAASKMLYFDRPEIIDRAGDGYTRAGAGLLRGRGETAQAYGKKEWIFGACAGAAIYRRSMLEEIGLFDEDFFLLYEDLDLSFRAQLQGYRCIYEPEAVVYHMASRTIGYDSEMSIYYGHRNLEWTYIQNMPASLIPKTVIQHLIYDLFAMAYFAAGGKARVFFHAKSDAVKGMKKAIEKRKIVQSRKRVDDQYIWHQIEPEAYLHRLFRRLKRRTGA
ncbi:MAG: glycosyltransferase family 2 protein [Thermodesulfobacteriota bacterium]